MSGVRINTMRVDTFRGISSETLFDFTSPLTLVFAPNGTGKSTMCEAAEWLLTGQVDRLRGKGVFEQKALRSKFAHPDQAPVVEAEIHLGGEALRLRRVVVGNQTQAQMGTTDAVLESNIGLNALLHRLAPSAAAADAHHLRAISLRQGWLRGTRFLSAEALATLVDSDDATIARRKDVFADLLGIRHLLEAEKLVGRYVADMNRSERALTKTVSERKEEISHLIAELQSTPPPAVLSASSEVAAAERSLGLATWKADDSQVTFGARMEALDVERHRREHMLGTRRDAINALTALWPQPAQLEARIRSLDVTHMALDAELAQIVEQGQATGRLVASATIDCDTSKERLRSLEMARTSLLPLCAAFVRALSGQFASCGLSGTSTLGRALDEFPRARQTSEGIATVQDEVRAALDVERGSADSDRRYDLLRGQLDAALKQQVSEESLAELRSEADRLEELAQRAKQRLQATAGPLSRLQTAGRELCDLKHDGHGASCPLCSHNWGSADRLREVMAATLTAVPEIERLAQQGVSAGYEASRLARVHLEDALRQTAQVERLRTEMATLERDAEARKTRSALLGISGADRISALETLERNLNIAAALSQLLRERDRLSTTLAIPVTLLSDSTAIQDLEVQSKEAIDAYEDVVRIELATAEKQLATHIELRDALRKDHAVATQAVRANREERARHQGELKELRQLWQRASPGTEWSDEGLNSARDWAQREQALLDDVASRAVAAKAAWTAEVRRLRVEALQQEVTPLSNRLAYMRERLGAAQHARKCFHQSYVEVSGRQIDNLGRVVNPLFARMHANRVFDRINFGQIDDPLRWLADAGSQELDPGKDFSQGQRQDLALALFLARARSLGGTFFLDEPVTHLDDLNRVGLLDIFRATVLESSKSLNLVVTTASKPLTRHIVEKFARVGLVEGPGERVHPLRVIELAGNGRSGVRLRTIFPVAA